MTRRAAVWSSPLWALVTFSLACTFGPRLETVPLAHRPAGVRVTATAWSARAAGETTLQGELLEARAEGLLVLTAGRHDPKASPAPSERRLVLVLYRVVEAARFEAVGQLLAERKPPGAGDLEKLRTISRFPQGLGTELLGELLRDCGQLEVEEWRP